MFDIIGERGGMKSASVLAYYIENIAKVKGN